MKVVNFRVRDRMTNKNKSEAQQLINSNHFPKQNTQDGSFNRNDNKFQLLMQSFQSFMSCFSLNFSENQPKKPQSNYQLNGYHQNNFEYRDRLVVIDLPFFQNRKIQLPKLSSWIGAVCKQSFSVAFNFYSSKKISYDQMKVFASESLLRNIAILVDTYNITKQQLKFLDKKMQECIYPYLKEKYPMTGEKQSYKSLQRAVKQIDNSQVLANDYFSQTDIRFPYRQNGRYGDLIMQLLNELISKLDVKNKQNNTNGFVTTFKDFENKMTQIFQKSYDENWMNYGEQNSNDCSAKSQIQKEKYRQSIQQYTKYVIGRKVTENIELFSEDQIRSGFLLIKNASILRIITKWCSQLWQKFDNQTYFLDRIEGLGLTVGKKITIVYPWLKDLLTNQMKEQKQNILHFMKEIEDTNYSQQVYLMKNQLDNQSEEHIEKYEKVAGKFACKVVKNVQNFIVIYLNRLIHGLTTVSKICFQQMKSYPDYWPYPFHLLSFKIGDLMRCKYSSKERQVLKIFQRIQKINDENPQKLKIIRIKNRLKLGTNDILINAKFNDGLTCQIQLAVNSVESQFTKFSYNINHYIYELERSLFGPISQSCNIWKNCQKRSKQFEKLIQRESHKRRKQLEKISSCQTKKKQHQLISYDKPFICSQCSKHHYHSNYMVCHTICSNCEYWKCAVCLIKENRKNLNKEFFIKNLELSKLCSFWQNQKSIPGNGVCVFIQKAPLEVIIYKKIQHVQKQYLFRKLDQTYYLIEELIGSKQIKKFIQSCILFDINDPEQKYLVKLDHAYARTKFIIPNYIQKCLKQEKQTISILRQQLKQIDMSTIKNANKQDMKNVKYIQFSSCSIDDLDLLSADFINLNCLNINLNKVTDISKVTTFSKLQRLYMNENKISQIPSSINLLKNLKELDIYGNQITSLPLTFSQLKQLTILNIGGNKLQNLPDNLYELQNLKQLIAKGNKFLEFPKSLCKHNNLVNINLAQCQISKMPEQIQNLGELKEMVLDNNKITQLPLKMTKMVNLQTLKLKGNKITSLNGIGDCIKLKQLILSSNQSDIKFPEQITKLKHLQFIDLSQNGLILLNQSFKNISQIKIIDLKQNKFRKIDELFLTLSNLETLQLQRNNITQVSPSIKQLTKLRKLDLSYNQLQSIPNQLILLELTELYLNFNKLNQIPNSLYYFPNLKKLQIKSNSQYKISQIPPNISNLKNLNYLNLQGNTVTKISESISKLQKLQTLNLNKNNLSIVSQNIFKIINLVDLSLQQNQLQDFRHDQQIKNLKKLNRINFKHNPIKKKRKYKIQNRKINIEFQTNHAFEEIDAQDLPLSQNNSSIVYTYINLKQIALDLNFIPSYVNSVRTVDFTGNKLQSFPQIVFYIKNLKQINVSNNLLSNISNNFQNKLNQLQYLNLSSNKLTQLPQSIGKLPSLIKLVVSQNDLKSLPTSIGQLKKLKKLLIKSNKIQYLPNQIGDLIYLQELNVAQNSLKYIPTTIGIMKNLENLFMFQNCIQQIPESIADCEKLTNIDLISNKIRHIPLRICQNANIKKLLLNQNLIEKIPKQIKKMTGLLNGQLYLSENPIQQVEDYDFVHQKGSSGTRRMLSIWKQQHSQKDKIQNSADNQNTENKPSNNHSISQNAQQKE